MNKERNQQLKYFLHITFLLLFFFFPLHSTFHSTFHLKALWGLILLLTMLF